MKGSKMKTKKSIGFYIGLLAFVLTVAYGVAYMGISPDLYNNMIVVYAVIGCLAFVLLSLTRKTSELAPAALMVCSMLSIMAFVSTDGMIDYLSTQFFGGFSMETILAMPFAIWFSVFAFVGCFLLGSLAMYLPQYKRVEK